jgi:sugar lactone lactonase YvrE
MGGAVQGSVLSLAENVSTFAGVAPGSIDGIGIAARFNNPYGVTTDGTNLYVADTANNTIRQIVIATGLATTLAGAVGVPGFTDGTGNTANFSGPTGITTDGTNLYVADTNNNTIRKIVIATGQVITLAGTAGVSGSTDGTGSAASFATPHGITTDGTNLYVVDSGNYTIRKIVIATGQVTTFAGTAGAQGSTDSQGTSARFNYPTGITMNNTNLYVADTANNTIRQIVIATGQVTTFAGSAGVLGSNNGIGATASFAVPSGITTDNTNLYVTDTNNNTIRQIVIATGQVTTLAGTAGISGFIDSTGAAARFNSPHGIITYGAYLYVVDTNNNSIREVVILTGQVTTFAGTASMGSADGTGAAANFNSPHCITTDGTNLYVVDSRNNTIRKIVIGTGQVTTFAGTAGAPGSSDGIGAAASFNDPFGITTDGTSLYVTDTNNSTIRQIVIATGKVTTLAGMAGVFGSTNGIGSSASFAVPSGITTDNTNLYVTDTNNNTIRKIVIATELVTTLAGTAGVPGFIDGTGAAARLANPTGITTDGANLYVADSGNNAIRKIVIATGQVTTLAGTASMGSRDGIGTAASFAEPFGITMDGTNLYVADSENYTIRKIVIATSQVTTLAGTAGVSGSRDGTGAAAKFNYPAGITTDGINLYAADAFNNTIRRIQ